MIFYKGCDEGMILIVIFIILYLKNSYFCWLEMLSVCLKMFDFNNCQWSLNVCMLLKKNLIYVEQSDCMKEVLGSFKVRCDFYLLFQFFFIKDNYY